MIRLQKTVVLEIQLNFDYYPKMTSKLTPNLTLFFPCESASIHVFKRPEIEEYEYGWWEIRKPLYHVFMPKGISKGFGTPELCLYYQLSGGRGEYEAYVEFRQLDLSNDKKSKLWFQSDPIHVSCPNELAVVEDIFVMERVPFPKPDLYQFQMKENGKVLPGGECYLRVFAGEKS